MQFLYSLADGISHRVVNEQFQLLARSTVLHNPDTPVISLPKKGMHDILRAAVVKILPNIAHVIDSVTPGQTVESLSADPKNRTVCLLEIIRYGYRKELIDSCVMPESYWKERTNESMRCAAHYGVHFAPAMQLEFLQAVDAKSKKVLKRKALLQAGETIPKKTSLTRKSLFKEYVNDAVLARLNDSKQLQEFLITTYALLAMGSRQLDPGKHLQLENELESEIVAIRAAMVMPRAMFDDFIKKMRTSSERLVGSAGSIIVHRPDDADPAEVDKAVQEFMKEKQAPFDSRLAKWGIGKKD